MTALIMQMILPCSYYIHFICVPYKLQGESNRFEQILVIEITKKFKQHPKKSF